MNKANPLEYNCRFWLSAIREVFTRKDSRYTVHNARMTFGLVLFQQRPTTVRMCRRKTTWSVLKHIHVLLKHCIAYCYFYELLRSHHSQSILELKQWSSFHLTHHIKTSSLSLYPNLNGRFDYFHPEMFQWVGFEFEIMHTHTHIHTHRSWLGQER